jgi:predicted 3-demethylubiquinone-9 3-methyltransferase (glyoxalase superfamily)
VSGTEEEQVSKVSKVYTCLWFDRNAEEAANLYVSLIPDSRIEGVHRSPADYPSGGKTGDVLLVDFTLSGHKLQGLNGGPDFKFTEASSIVVECEDQAEIDRLWDALTKDGGEPGPCGWLKDRFGLSWQITPRELNEMLDSPDKDGAGRAMEAMLRMGKIDLEACRRAFAGETVATSA